MASSIMRLQGERRNLFRRRTGRGNRIPVRVVYEQTPEKLSRELGELNPDNRAEPGDARDGPMELVPVKKFPIN